MTGRTIVRHFVAKSRSLTEPRLRSVFTRQQRLVHFRRILWGAAWL